MTKADDPTLRVLEELGRVIRGLTRLGGGPDDGPAMTATQRLALFELVEEGPMRLNDLASLLGTSAPSASRAVDALAEAGLVDGDAALPDPVGGVAAVGQSVELLGESGAEPGV